MTTEKASIQTSVPDWVMTYCRQLAEVHFKRKLNGMYVHMLQSFLAHRPWEANPPFPWRSAKLHKSPGLNAKNGADLGWVAMNMTLPQTLVDQIRHTVESINLSHTGPGRALGLRTFLYTVICWWCTCVYPYENAGVLKT